MRPGGFELSGYPIPWRFYQSAGPIARNPNQQPNPDVDLIGHCCFSEFQGLIWCIPGRNSNFTNRHILGCTYWESVSYSITLAFERRHGLVQHYPNLWTDSPLQKNQKRKQITLFEWSPPAAVIFDTYFDITSGIVPDKYSIWRSFWHIHPTFHLAFCLAFYLILRFHVALYLTFVLTFYLAFFVAFYLTSLRSGARSWRKSGQNAEAGKRSGQASCDKA